MASHIKLYSGKAQRFEEIKQHIEDKLGYEPTNPEVIGILMGLYDAENQSGSSIDR